MKFISLTVLVIATLLSQNKGNGHFITTEEPVDKYYKMYSPFMLNLNAGYMFHQSIEIPRIDYKDGIGIQFDANFYFFQGMYLFLSVTHSKTVETVRPFVNELNELKPGKSDDYIYLTPIVGLKYYFRKQKEIDTPWYISFGFGQNYFIGDNDFNRFSGMFELGKITNANLGKSKMYFSFTAHIFEGKGFRPYLLTNGYIYDNIVDFKSYMSVKLNIGLHLNLTENTIRY